MYLKYREGKCEWITRATFNSTATFPIMNESAAEEILGNDDPADDEETPGFGIIAGAGALGLAAAWASRRDD